MAKRRRCSAIVAASTMLAFAACANGRCASSKARSSAGPLEDDGSAVTLEEHHSSANLRAEDTAEHAGWVEQLEWADPVVVDRGPAFAGPWRMNDSRFHYVDDPTVVADEHGGAIVAWVDNQRQDVFFQRVDAQGKPQLDGPVNVSDSPEIFSWLPRMAVAKDGTIHVLWQEIVFSGGTHGGEAFFARSVDGGRQFSEPVNLSSTQAGCGKGRLTAKRWHNGSLDLVVGTGDEVYAAWTEYEGPLRFSRSVDDGASFSEPLKVAGSNGRPARGPSLAVGPDATLYVAWAVGEDARGDIRWSRSRDGGKTFSTPKPVVRTEGFSDAPKLIVDPRGAVHVVFAERSDMFGDARVLYTRREAGAHEFAPPRPIAEAADFPSFSRASEDRLFVVWEHHPQGAEQARGLGIAVSKNGGRSFTSPSLVPHSVDVPGVNGSRQGKLMRKLDVGPKGQMAIVNSHFDPGNRSVVRLLRARF